MYLYAESLPPGLRRRPARKMALKWLRPRENGFEMALVETRDSAETRLQRRFGRAKWVRFAETREGPRCAGATGQRRYDGPAVQEQYPKGLNRRGSITWDKIALLFKMLEQLYPFSDRRKRFHQNGCCSRIGSSQPISSLWS